MENNVNVIETIEFTSHPGGQMEKEVIYIGGNDMILFIGANVSGFLSDEYREIIWITFDKWISTKMDNQNLTPRTKYIMNVFKKHQRELTISKILDNE